MVKMTEKLSKYDCFAYQLFVDNKKKPQYKYYCIYIYIYWIQIIIKLIYDYFQLLWLVTVPEGQAVL